MPLRGLCSVVVFAVPSIFARPLTAPPPPPSQAYPAYELKVADLTVADVSTLSVRNLRALFADREYEPVVELQREAEPVRSRFSRW